MVDMFTGMPVWWQGPIPDNVSGVMQNNLAQQQAMNQASSNAVTQNSYNTAAQSQAFMDAARAQNNAAYNQAVQFAMLNSSTGGSKPGGYYGPGSGLSSFSGVSLGGGYPSGKVTRGADLPQPDLGGYDPLGGGGGGGMVMHNDGQWRPSTGGGIGSDAVAGRNSLANIMAGYANMYRQPAANPSYFNPGTYAGSQGNYGIPFNGRPMAGDIGSQGNKNMPNLGYNPGMQNWFAPQARPNAYAPLGGAMQFPNSGTPSQYAPGSRMPPGFSQPYSFDEPGGALPLLNNQTTGGGGA